MKYQIEMTRSQVMAIVNVLIEYQRIPDHAELFVNCSEDPAVETTPEELLELFHSAKPMRPVGVL
jgi:hypothetical protein